jgi:oxygen-dependent protoporphyrinogen oxidase
MKEECKALVIGGGVSGLCAAYYLARLLGKEHVQLIESAGILGGTAWTDYADGFSCETGANGFLDKEPLTLQWVEDLGIADKLVRANKNAARRFILRNDTLHEIKPPPRFFTSSLLSPAARARLVCEPFIPKKKNDLPESIWSFAARRIGKEAADVLVASMVSGVYGGDAKQLSLKHCFPKMAEMEQKHGSLTKALIAKMREKRSNANAMGPAGTLTSFTGGMSSLLNAAAEELEGAIHLNTAGEQISYHKDHFKVETTSGTVNARYVIPAIPTYHVAQMFKAVDRNLVSALEAIPYAGLAVVCTGYPREDVAHDLNGFGFLAPRIDNVRALGCLWTSSLFPNRAPEGYVMLRTMFGGFTDPEAVTLSDADLLDSLKEQIHPVLGINCTPEFVRIYRHTRGIPQYLMGHGARLKTIEASESQYPGLIFAGNAYRGISLNDCVVSAHRAVNSVKALEKEI